MDETKGTKAGGAAADDASASHGSEGDRALVLGRVADDALAVLRKRSASAPIEAGVVRPLREGQPIVGEVVKLTPVTETPGEPVVCNVEVQFAAPELPGVPKKGPPRVSSARYRAGWDNVFGATKGASSEKSGAN